MTGHGLAAYRDESLYLVGTTFSSQYSSSFYPDFPLCEDGIDDYFIDSSWALNDVGEMPYISRFSIIALNVGIDDSPAERRSFLVWPNPSSSFVWMSSNVKGEGVILNVFAQDGRLVLSRQMYSQSEVLDITNWPSALYVIEVISGDGAQHTSFIKL